MPKIGKFNTLKVVKAVDFGVYLDGEALGEILLPQRYVPQGCQPGDSVEVFLYHDSEDRLIATTLRPYAGVGELALLKVAAVNNFGAFLDWGLPKDLLVPFKEQQQRMKEGCLYTVYVYLDTTSQRIAASSKLKKFLAAQPTVFEKGQPVDLQISDRTDMGYTAIIDRRLRGVLYHNEVFQKLRLGQRIQGFIKNVRSDGKIDLSLEKPGYEKVLDQSENILAVIQSHGGFMDVTDKTSAERIYSLFGISKKTFKKAIGTLYKAHRISLEKDGIALTRKNEGR
ncbi:MAG: S1-like domain-containing RNA-binding protein [Desulfobacterales bacterium]|nr:S1-like domain-containing RNA-binding protein [Desulfobacterales bacterium]